MSKDLIKTISTFFGLGYLPVMPGTFGSCAGLLIYLMLPSIFPGNFILILFMLALGFVVSSQAKKIFGLEDPPEIVFDEVCGIFISLLFLPKTWPVIFCAFFLFRGFDTVKPWPIDKLEKVPNGAGIMLDDIMAGVYTNICIQIALALTSKF